MTKTRAEIVAITIVVAITITSLTSFENNKVFGEPSYKMADDVTAVLTFTFRDGVEIHEFPVFKMTEDYLENRATTFEVQGVLNNAPHLFQVLDDTYKYRVMKQTADYSGYDYDYRYFDIDVDFSRSGESVRTLNYVDCQIDDYVVETLNDDYESYLSSKTGFVIVNTLEFNCGGVDTSKITKASTVNKVRTMYEGKTSSIDTVMEPTKTNFDFASGIRTFVTFEFDHGIEKIEFPIFEITSGFEDDSVASFHVEGIVGKQPMLEKAINKARDISKRINTTYNNDFQAKVEFVQGTLMGGEKILRAIHYVDCRLTESEISTYYDKEEGWTGKSGFAIVDKLDVECAGQEPVNPNYNKIYGDTPIWKTSTGAIPIVQEDLTKGHNMSTGPHAIATFYFQDNTIQVVDFPRFEQQDVLGESYPTFELAGVVGDYPMLYKRVDDKAKFMQLSGSNHGMELFEIDVNLVYDNQVMRGFQYTDCRVNDYVVETTYDKEESFFKGFALENIFEFECYGYKPNNPVYHAMFDIYDKADTISSMDLRETQDWSEVYKYYQ